MFKNESLGNKEATECVPFRVGRDSNNYLLLPQGFPRIAAWVFQQNPNGEPPHGTSYEVITTSHAVELDMPLDPALEGPPRVDRVAPNAHDAADLVHQLWWLSGH